MAHVRPSQTLHASTGLSPLRANARTLFGLPIDTSVARLVCMTEAGCSPLLEPLFRRFQLCFRASVPDFPTYRPCGRPTLRFRGAVDLGLYEQTSGLAASLGEHLWVYYCTYLEDLIRPIPEGIPKWLGTALPRHGPVLSHPHFQVVPSSIAMTKLEPRSGVPPEHLISGDQTAVWTFCPLDMVAIQADHNVILVAGAGFEPTTSCI